MRQAYTIKFGCLGEHQFHTKPRSKLKLVAPSDSCQSSAEAETSVYASAARNLQFTLTLHSFEFLDRPQQLPIRIYTDNSATRDSIKKLALVTMFADMLENNFSIKSHLCLCPTLDIYFDDDMMTAEIFTNDKTTFLRQHRSSFFCS
eukprot:scaffold318635_cov35-Tisochrysis_lutea.AAC.1